ncbi:MAG: hypothetical protein KGL95_15690 [Patescibacteria group bacterium]|nr:hypothetical protein [Patescibacteria group bacterium]
MKAVIGILVIFVGFFIEYSVFTGKLPPQGGIQPPISSSNNLPTAQSTSSGFSGTTGQGQTSGNIPVYNPPPVAGRKV